MTRTRWPALVALAVLGCSSPPAGAGALAAPERITAGALCTTHGTLGTAGDRIAIRDATVRAVATGHDGDAATLRFTYLGPSKSERALASGQLRRQLGLKLRAADGCNLVYVMWRLEPEPGLVVSVKRVPGSRTHAECGTRGYAQVKPRRATAVPAPAPGATHTLRAAITGDELRVWLDAKRVWRGVLPRAARSMHGPPGLRTDNIAVDVELLASPLPDGAHRTDVPGCP